MRNSRFHLPVACILFIAATMSCRAGSSASGASGTRLALSEPSNQWMAQGDSKKVAIHVDRTGFGDSVRIQFSNLPKGVRAESDTILAGDSNKNFVLVASPTAPPVERHIVTVTAMGSNISTSQTFEISIKTKS